MCFIETMSCFVSFDTLYSTDEQIMWMRLEKITSQNSKNAHLLGLDFIEVLWLCSLSVSVLLHQDGTLKLWDYESGSELQSLDLRQLDETTSSEADKDKVSSVFHPVTLRLQHRFSLT